LKRLLTWLRGRQYMFTRRSRDAFRGRRHRLGGRRRTGRLRFDTLGLEQRDLHGNMLGRHRFEGVVMSFEPLRRDEVRAHDSQQHARPTQARRAALRGGEVIWRD
jgi:hypothetical protein